MGNSQTHNLSTESHDTPHRDGPKTIKVGPKQITLTADRKYQVGMGFVVQSPTSHQSKKCEKEEPKYRTQLKSNAVRKVREKLKQVTFLNNEVTPQHTRTKRASLSQSRVKKFSSNPTTKSRRKKKISKKTASKNDYYVLRLAFNLFSRGKDTISVEDLHSFFTEYTNENCSYQEVRDMVHRACNEYEIDFDCFQRIVCMDDSENALRTNVIVSCESVPHIPTLPGQVNLEPDTIPEYDSTVQWSTSLDEENGCTDNRRAFLEDQKKRFGLFNAKFSRSFTARNTSVAVKQSLLDCIVNHGCDSRSCKQNATQKTPPASPMKRCISENAKFTPAEEQYFKLKDVFKTFDICQFGSIQSSDLHRVMNEMGLKVNRGQIRLLFSLLGKKKKSERQLDFAEFVTLYRECSLC